MYSFGFIRGVSGFGVSIRILGVYLVVVVVFFEGGGGSSVLPRFKALKLVPIVITGYSEVISLTDLQ